MNQCTELKFAQIANAKFTQTSPKEEYLCLTLFQPLDFEKVAEYRFDIEATDPTVDLRYFKSGGSRSISTVTIEVTDVDEPPVFTKLPYEFKVRENDPEIRTLGSVWAHDPDAAKRKIR